MVSFLKGRRREDDSVVAVDSNGRNVAAALEALVARAEAAANDLRSLAPILERPLSSTHFGNAAKKSSARLPVSSGSAAQLSMAEEQVERVIKTQTATEARLGHASEGRGPAPDSDGRPERQGRDRASAARAGRLIPQPPGSAERAPDRFRDPPDPALRAGRERRPDADPARRRPDRPPSHDIPAGKLRLRTSRPPPASWRMWCAGCSRSSGRSSRSIRPRPRFPTSSTSWPCSRRWPTRSPRRPRCWSRSARRWIVPPARSPSSPVWTGSWTPGSAGRKSRSAGSARSRPS